MCGFAGILTPAGESPDPGTLQRMGSVLLHRGPDDGGFAVLGPCGLVHRRLSVIDLSTQGRQPMSNEDGTVWMAYNGQVYNHLELRRSFDLDGRGHSFRSKTDTEVLVHLYEELGEGMLPLLDGMFALAIWDARESRLLLARDRFGIKPLFYCRKGGQLAFASEIKSLLELDGMEREPEPEALFHYLSMDYIPGGLTAFRGISELRPGHVVSTRDPSSVNPTPFTGPEPAIDPTITAGEAVERAGSLLAAAVKRQLVSDVPVGVMPSGGMDSSALAALMSDSGAGAGFHSFSLRFSDPSFDESRYAEMVAFRLGTSHHVIDVEPGVVADLLPVHMSFIDEPYADGSAIPTFLLAREAKNHVAVLLSGEGGDEFFGGYDTHAAMKIRKAYRRVPAFIRKGLIRPLAHSLPVSHRKLSFDFKVRRFTEGAELDVPGSHFHWRVVLTEDAKRSVFAGGEGYPPTDSFFRQVYDGASGDDLARILKIDSSFHLPDDLMIKNDRMTMAHSIEARVPFTDLELVAFLASVPSAVKLPGLRKKHLLREAMRGRLPEAVLRKKKVGLEMPYSSWMRRELRSVVEEELGGPALGGCPLLEPSGVRSLWEDHLAMRADNGRALWGLLNYMIWHRLYISSSGYRANLRIGDPVADVRI